MGLIPIGHPDDGRDRKWKWVLPNQFALVVWGVTLPLSTISECGSDGVPVTAELCTKSPSESGAKWG